MSAADDVAAVIGEHYDVVFLNGVWCCPCGSVLANTEVDARLRRDGHLARVIVLADWLVARDAQTAAGALREAADALPWHVHAPSDVQAWLQGRAAKAASRAMEATP